jgi:UDP-N-acetylmuramate dehydrogenase
VLTEAYRRELIDTFGERVRFSEPLSRHTSFRIGGPADVWLEVDDAGDIARIHKLAAPVGVPVWIVGGGTNLLVADRGVRGIVVHLGKGFAKVEWHDGGDHARARAGSAVPLKKLVIQAIDRGLEGLEFAEGIPGSVGGGLLMNAGAFGGDISGVVDYVQGVDRVGEPRRLVREELRFEYRNFDLEPGFIVTHIGFVLRPGVPGVIRARREEAKRRREAHQPIGYPNAGSIFKNPPGEFAGRLIEAVGLKGFRIGGAMLSQQHANFIVNLGGATAADVRALMRAAEERVWELKRIRLQPEIKLVGDWES